VSRFFINRYLDEDVSWLVGELLRCRGYNVLSTQDAGQTGMKDPQQLAYAAQQQRAILTHHRNDFQRLAQEYLSSGQSHSGIIIAVRRPPHDIAGRLLRLLNQITADEMDNQVFYI
jgi:predicted nuclease of predicted toxin-antitoxin system